MMQGMPDSPNDPMQPQMPDLPVRLMLHHLDLSSLLRCRLVSDSWRRRVESCGPWVRLTRQLGVADCDRGLTALRAWQLLALSGVVCAEMPEEAATDEALATSWDYLQPLPNGSDMAIRMLDTRRCCLLRRRLRVRQFGPEGRAVEVRCCAASSVALLRRSTDPDGLCAAVPLNQRPGGAEGDSVAPVATLRLPETRSLADIGMATRVSSSGGIQLIVITKAGLLQLWNLPAASEDASKEDDALQPPLLEVPHQFQRLDWQVGPYDLDSIVIASVSPPGYYCAVAKTVVITKSAALPEDYDLIDYRYWSFNFFHIAEDSLDHLQEEDIGSFLSYYCTSFVVTTEGEIAHCDVCRLNPCSVFVYRYTFTCDVAADGLEERYFRYSPEPKYILPLDLADCRLIGYGISILCFICSCSHLVLFKVRCPEPVSIVNLSGVPQPSLAFLASDWLDRGLQYPQRGTCPLIVMQTGAWEWVLLSWTCDQPPSAASGGHSMQFRVKFLGLK